MNINVKPPSILIVACPFAFAPCINLQHPPITAALMDPPDAPATFLGASPFTNYLRELSSQDIANRALLTIASQNDRLTSPIALTIASCLDDPIADDHLDDNRLIILSISSAPIASPCIVDCLDDPLAKDRPVAEQSLHHSANWLCPDCFSHTFALQRGPCCQLHCIFAATAATAAASSCNSGRFAAAV
jgi:hypothetical protein